MCLKSSSKSSSASSSSTVSRDERIAADGGASIISVKDIAGALSFNVTDASPEVLELQADFLEGAANFLGAALDDVFALASAATGFARDTQAAYEGAVRDEMTNDLTQVIEKSMNVLLIAGALFVAWQVMK